MKIIRGIFLVIAITISFSTYAGAGWTFKNFHLEQTGGFSSWESETLITAGPQKGQKVSQRTCVDTQQSGIGAVNAQAAGALMDNCKSKVIQDTDSYAEGVQTCDSGVSRSETIIKMTKLSDTSYETTLMTTSTDGTTIATQTTTKYAGSCVPEKIPASPSAECGTSKKTVADMKAKCKTGEIPAQVCDKLVKQLEAASTIGCGK
jgi:hypothetical protein